MPLSGQPSEQTRLGDEAAQCIDDAKKYIRSICETIKDRPGFLAGFITTVNSIIRPEMENLSKAFPGQNSWFEIDDKQLTNPFQPSITLRFRIPTISSLGDKGDTPYASYRAAKGGNFIVGHYSTRHPDIGGSEKPIRYLIAKLTPELVRKDLARVFLDSVKNFYEATNLTS